MSTGRKRRRLEGLWMADPQCRCCGTLTVLPADIMEDRNGLRLPKAIPDNMASIQHHDSKLSAARGTGIFGMEERTTLYCHACNQRENEITQAGVPVVIRRARSRLGHILRSDP